MSNLDRLLRTIGKTNFVEYYEDYQNLVQNNKNINTDEKMRLANKLLKTNPKATKVSGQLARISAATQIFQNGWEKEALQEVINSSHKAITNEIKMKALSLQKQSLQ
ncbi:hypothetical protein PGC35_04895 [Psychrobacillus sp. PGGUH221]|uniref:hypothetical protein n=1 Tax=Psychrobacillus sp. PGGUH221 TaxID=3020058 RepID=UPI0035C700EA